MPYTGTWPIGRTTAGAVTLALENINRDVTLTALRHGGHNFSAVWRDTKCLDSEGLPEVVNLWAIEKVDGFIGEFIFCLYLCGKSLECRPMIYSCQFQL